MDGGNNKLQVIKRDGTVQDVDFRKIHWRIKSLCAYPSVLEFQRKERPEAYEFGRNLTELKHANPDAITLQTFNGLYNGVPTTAIDVLSADNAQNMCTYHPDNSELAKRIFVSNIQKNVKVVLQKNFPNVHIKRLLFRYSMEALYYNINNKGEQAPLIAPYLMAIAIKYGSEIEKLIDYSRDFTNHDYLGIKMLEKGYLMRCNQLPGAKEKNVIVETPQIADMRVSIANICAPTPCPTYFKEEDMICVLKEHPDVVKEKYRDNIDKYREAIFTKPVSKFVDRRRFKETYWRYLLDKAMSQLKNEGLSDKVLFDITHTYNMISKGYYTPATPTRFNLGTLRPQCSSCFLIAMESDSLSGIYNTLKKQAIISKYAGGVGMWVHNIRSAGSYIEGTNGRSNGLRPMLRIFDASSIYVDQGGGKRPGSTAIYMEIWNADFFEWIELRRKQGDELQRTRSLFYGLWICDEFWRCLKTGKDWYLFDPSIVPKLYDSYDEKFSTEYLSDQEISDRKKEFLFTYRYRKYVRENKYTRRVSPQKILLEIINTVRESGIPYMLCKDAANRKSNQKNLGVIKSSNLCTEIIQYSDSSETAVCNLHSIVLTKFLRKWTEGDSKDFKYQVTLDELLQTDGPRYLTFDFTKLGEIVERIVNNLNRIIDLNFYPTPCAERSNFNHRPMGIGIQGEADMFSLLRLEWGGKKANKLRFHIMEHLYYHALKTSNKIARVHGYYASFKGSPTSQGYFQFDLWINEGRKLPYPLMLGKEYNDLKEDVKRWGLRNSLFVSPMPTSSSAAILGNSPCFEPHIKLVYKRQVGAGEEIMVNKFFVKDMDSLGLWNKEMSNRIINANGSVQSIPEIPDQLKTIYLTAYEIPAKQIVDASYHRAWFVDQSQSLNLFFNEITTKNLTTVWTRGWRKGLKTLSYYCRSRAAINAQKLQTQPTENNFVCMLEDGCLSCQS